MVPGIEGLCMLRRLGNEDPHISGLALNSPTWKGENCLGTMTGFNVQLLV